MDLFEYAKDLRDRGMIAAETAEELRGEDFSTRALEAICAVARRQIHVHVDHVLAEGVPQPAHPNAWGAVWMRAIKLGVIQRSNQVRPCKTDPRKHSHNYPVYFSRIYGG